MPEGLDQVDLPWALGASNWCSPMIVPPVLPLRGAIDELEIAARP
jgi:hypothetical protein